MIEADKPVLEQLLDLMLQRGQIDREQYNTLQEKAKKEAAVHVGFERRRPFIQSSDGNFRFDFGGRFQLDFDRAEDGAKTLTGANLGSEFLVRRARFELMGQAYKWIEVKIEADFTDSQPLRDVSLDLKLVPELFRLRGGQFKVPFSLEELTSDLYTDFVERSVVYLYRAGNSVACKTGIMLPFHHHERGQRDGITPLFLPVGAVGSALAVLHVACCLAQ